MTAFTEGMRKKPVHVVPIAMHKLTGILWLKGVSSDRATCMLLENTGLSDCTGPQAFSNETDQAWVSGYVLKPSAPAAVPATG